MSKPLRQATSKKTPDHFVRALVCAIFFSATASARTEAQTLPGAIGDEEFWRLISDLSEPGGTFMPQLMSNEDSALFVIPALRETVRQDGVYIGVGSEQNFTYIGALRPRLAFVVDIRRDNMLEHLMYKALFELSSDRSDFISRLFSLPRPASLDTDAGVTELFAAFRELGADAALLEANLDAVLDRLMNRHGFGLNDADQERIADMMNAFHTAGPDALQGFGDRTNPTYAQLMAARDPTGRPQSYLASEESFGIVQELERKNLVIPMVGDFAGDKTIVGIGAYLRERNAAVDVFYVSNVERYLFDQGEAALQFYANLRELPLDPASSFIRSVTSDISLRLGIPIPDAETKWRTFLSPIDADLDALEEGRIRSYRDLFRISP